MEDNSKNYGGFSFPEWVLIFVMWYGLVIAIRDFRLSYEARHPLSANTPEQQK